MLRTVRRLLRCKLAARVDPKDRQALAITARRHLHGLSKARRMLPDDPVIEQQYAAMEDLVRQAGRR